MTNIEQFEAWATRHEVNTMRVTVGDAYMTNAAYITWEAWQARGEVDAKRIAELEERHKRDSEEYHLMHVALTSAKSKLAIAIDALEIYADGYTTPFYADIALTKIKESE